LTWWNNNHQFSLLKVIDGGQHSLASGIQSAFCPASTDWYQKHFGSKRYLDGTFLSQELQTDPVVHVTIEYRRDKGCFTKAIESAILTRKRSLTMIFIAMTSADAKK